MTDPTPAPVARDEIAAVIWAHQPRREKSGRIHGCTCNAWFSQIGVEASHRAHLADALLASHALAAHAPPTEPAPAPVARDAAMLTDDERERLTTSLRWHFDVVAEEGKGSPYASTGIRNALRIVERILAARQPVATETEGADDDA